VGLVKHATDKNLGQQTLTVVSGVEVKFPAGTIRLAVVELIAVEDGVERIHLDLVKTAEGTGGCQECFHHVPVVEWVVAFGEGALMVSAIQTKAK
jgi:hypothetical protein